MPYDWVKSNVDQDITLNGLPIPEDEKWDFVQNWIEEKFKLIKFCPFCFSPLRTAEKITEGKHWIEQEVEVKECHSCGYWQSYGLRVFGTYMGCPDASWECRISKIHEYDQIPEGCFSELAQFIRAKPSFLHSIEPKKLEKLVAEIFRRNYANAEVIHVGKPDDGGVDVIFIDSGSRQWMIQVKRREKSDASEGVGTLRNLLGAMVLKDSKYGIVVSTADHFTYRAYSAKNQAAKVGYLIRLIDKGKLIRMFDPVLPKRPWLGFLKDSHPELLEYFFQAMPDRNQLSLF